MTDPSPAAIEAAAEAIQRAIEGWMNYDDEDWTLLARDALAAALPIVRAELAEQIEAAIENPTDDTVDAYHYDGLHEAARIVRGDNT